MYIFIFFFKQKTAYDMRISDWSSDVCSSDLFEYLGEVLNLSRAAGCDQRHVAHHAHRPQLLDVVAAAHPVAVHAVEHDLPGAQALGLDHPRSEERRVGKECVSTCRSRWSPYH